MVLGPLGRYPIPIPTMGFQWGRGIYSLIWSYWIHQWQAAGDGRTIGERTNIKHCNKLRHDVMLVCDYYLKIVEPERTYKKHKTYENLHLQPPAFSKIQESWNRAPFQHFHRNPPRPPAARCVVPLALLARSNPHRPFMAGSLVTIVTSEWIKMGLANVWVQYYILCTQ